MTTPTAAIPCEEVIRRVWDYLDGEIDGARRKRIRQHLELCDHCRDHYTFEDRLLRSLGELLADDSRDPLTTLRDRIERTLMAHGILGA